MKMTLAQLNDISKGRFPELIKMQITEVSHGSLKAQMPVEPQFFAPNGFLHAGSIVTLADTMAGYAAVAHLPDGAKSFTTLELKCSFIKAIREGYLEGHCTAEHLGRSTQVWQVSLYDPSKNRKIAIFSCT